MDITYYIFLLTFLLFPITPLVVYQFTQFDSISKFIKWVIAFLLFYDILFLFRFSFKGYFADFFVFAIEYLILCFALCLKSQRSYVNILRFTARCAIIFGVMVGLIGIFIFPIIGQDYKPDKTFRFVSNNKSYETRKYSSGFVTAANTRYTFVTFRQYSFLPIEKKIDKTVFFDTKSNLNIDGNKFQINVQTIDKKEKIVFKDNEGNIFSKLLN